MLRIEPIWQVHIHKPQNCLFLDIFWQFMDLIMIIFWTTQDIDNQEMTLEPRKSVPQSAKLSWTFVYKWLKIEPAFLPSCVNSAFCFFDSFCTQRSPNVSKNKLRKLCIYCIMLYIVLFAYIVYIFDFGFHHCVLRE